MSYLTVDLNCASCGVVFGITAEYRDRRRIDHASFTCPNGHTNVFRGPTEEEKQIEQLKRQWQDSAAIVRQRDLDVEDWRRALRVCPICEEVTTRAIYVETIRLKVAEHLRSEHGARQRLRALPPGREESA